MSDVDCGFARMRCNFTVDEPRSWDYVLTIALLIAVARYSRYSFLFHG